MVGDVYTTTVNVNGETVFKSRYSPCCCSMSYSPMMSCFGYGFGGCGYGGFGFYPGSFSAGLGMGVGFATGAALTPALPNIVKGIGKGLCWVGKNAVVPAAKGVWNGIKWLGNKIGSLFHKKDKPTTKDEAVKKDKKAAQA